MAEYHHRGHSVTDLKYHLIWVTKCRFAVLKRGCGHPLPGPAAPDLPGAGSEHRAWGGIARPCAPAGERAPLLAPAKLVQYLKGSSSRRLQEEFPALRKRYWGQHLWARGYFCATVGVVDEKTIKRYIEEQKWDEDGEGQFRIVTGK